MALTFHERLRPAAVIRGANLLPGRAYATRLVGKALARLASAV
jgi:hypothetical protein